MKNLRSTAAVLIVLAAAFFVSCGGSSTTETATESGYADGVYFAQATEYAGSGYKYNVTIVVENGEVAEAHWNGSNINGGVDKVTLSKEGNYPMVAAGGAQAEWFEQAAVVEAYFVENPNLSAPDAISGATIGYADFYSLASEALAAGPVGYGPFVDGVYHAEGSDFENGYKYFVDITVTSGFVVTAHWDAIAEDGGSNKFQRSVDGEYGMNGEAGQWHEQALATEKAFIESQSTATPDSISGATIGYEGFFALATEALSGAQR